MAKQKSTQIYEQSVLDGKLELSYGVDYKSFDALKTCGMGENTARIGDKKISPYVSTWLTQGGDLKLLLADPSERDSAPLRDKLCSNLVLLGLNAGSMDKITPAWHFFHCRFKKGTEELIETASERYLKEYITKCGLPFEGAYMTDILKFQDVTNSLYIEPNSEKVKTTAAVEHHNFEILKNELNILRGNMPANGKMLLVPLGGKCEDCLKSFIAWLPEEERAWIVVPPMYMAHYSQAGWNNQLSKARVLEMKAWCDEHISANA